MDVDAREVVAAVTSSKTDSEIDAIDLLKKDHDDVDALFNDYRKLTEGKGDASDRSLVSTRMCGLPRVHAMLEEEIFYPTAPKAGVEADLFDEAEIKRARPRS